MKDLQVEFRRRIVVPCMVSVALLAATLFGATSASAQLSTNATAMLNGYNTAFLYTSGSTAYYTNSVSDRNSQSNWGLALDIEGEEDAYEVTGDPKQQALINNLLNTFLNTITPTSTWASDPWNDDIGWMCILMARGYQMTGNVNFLNAAEYGFNMAYNRGWDTSYAGGGIVEEQPTGTGKNSLANYSLGKAAAIIYQATGNTTYLNYALQIYSWMWHNLFNPSTGLVYTAVNPDGSVDEGASVYNQGNFADYANQLYECGAGGTYLNDATSALNYGINNLTSNGVFSNSAGYLVTWAGEFARAIGHVCAYSPSLWAKYYPFMVNNVNAIWANRRTDYNITWNGWNQQTPTDNSDAADPGTFVSALTMEIFTPAAQPPTSLAGGTFAVINKLSGLALDNPGSNNTSGTYIDQYTWFNTNNDYWTFSQNSDGSYTIINKSSGLALNDYGFGTSNGAKVDESTPTGNSNQHWYVKPGQDGTYTITNVYSGLALDDPNFSIANNTQMDQWSSNGGSNQCWRILPANTQAARSIDPSKTYEIQNVNSSLALNVDGGSTANNAAVIQWPFSSGQTNALWTFVPTSAGYYQIENVNSKLDAAVLGNSLSWGASIIQYSFGSTGNDQWEPVLNTDGTYTFFNLLSGLVLDDPAASSANGTQFDQYIENATAAQKFKLISQ